MLRFTSVESFIITILAILVIVILVGAIYAFIRSIGLFIFSHWEAEEKKKARNWIRFMIIWIMLTIVLLFFFKYILKFLWVSTFEDYSAENIFARVSELLSNLLNFGKNVASDWFNNSWNEGLQDSTNNIDVSDYEL